VTGQYNKGRDIVSIRTVARSFYFDHVKSNSNGLMQRSLDSVLKRIDRSSLTVKHALADKYPGVIKPEVSAINISLTSSCNLRCKGCLYGRSFMPKEILDLDTVKQLLDDIRTLKIPKVHFYGGEPLVHPHIKEIVAYSSKIGLIPSLGTNAVLLDQKTVDDLYASGLRSITIGLYGLEDSFDEYTGRKGQFEKLKRNLKYVKQQYSDIEVTFAWLIMKPTCNAESIDKLWAFVQEMNIPFGISLVHYDFPYFCDGSEQELQIYEEDLPNIKATVNKLISIKNAAPEMLQNTLIGLNAIPDWLIKKGDMKVPCYMYDDLWVGPNGMVQVCQKSHDLGNINETRLKDILNSDLHKQAAKDCFTLQCSNCHVRFDSRTRNHLSSRAKYKTINIMKDYN
jgi:cyclic pyranopterin phosphate synthase